MANSNPHINAPFTQDYAERPIEKMRQCLRDLRTVVDHESARKVRERCKDNLTSAATGFRELNDEYRAVVEEAERLQEIVEVNGDWERRYRLVQGTIEDVLRGLVDVEELRQIAKDFADGTKQLEKA